jgi:hypothetical protein
VLLPVNLQTPANCGEVARDYVCHGVARGFIVGWRFVFHQAAQHRRHCRPLRLQRRKKFSVCRKHWDRGSLLPSGERKGYRKNVVIVCI